MGTRATYQNVLVFDEDGPVENELRFRDECVRHKALDLVGDLALAGCDLVGQFIAHRSGHRLNAELVRALLDEEEIVEAGVARPKPTRSATQGTMNRSPHAVARMKPAAKRNESRSDFHGNLRRRTMPSIHPRAEIDMDVEIGPFCVIGPNVRIGRGTRLENNVTLMGRVTLGQHNHIFPGVVIGGEPQDISYRGSDTQVDHRRPQHHPRVRDDQPRPPKRKTASRPSAATTS